MDGHDEEGDDDNDSESESVMSQVMPGYISLGGFNWYSDHSRKVKSSGRSH